MSECKFCEAELARKEDDECQECHDVWVWMQVNPMTAYRMINALTNQRSLEVTRLHELHE